MYDYDRRIAASTFDLEAHDYQRVMSSLTQDVVKTTVKLISDALKLADDAVRSLKFNQSVKVHDDLEKLEKPLVSLARWMTSRRELEAAPVSQFAQLTSELAEETKFWKRPVFLNKDDHTEKVEAIYKKMRRVRDDVLRAFKQSGSWKSPMHAI